nr:leucyl/phenylalanyl-tRNA--protein transferase [Cutibacterium granulosum]
MEYMDLFGDPDQWPDSDLLCLTGVLGPHLVLAALHEGVFPMPLGDDAPREYRGATAWWSPQRRGVLPLDRLTVSSSLRKTTKHRTTTVDQAFDRVIERCADPSRPGGWIDSTIIDSYTELHHNGWAHSVETWDEDGRLVGGLYGVSVGGLFSGESMFHDPVHGRDASKTALIRLVLELGMSDQAPTVDADQESRCGTASDTTQPPDASGPSARDESTSTAPTPSDGPAPGQQAVPVHPTALLDVQWLTHHLASLGAVEIDRAEYLRQLTGALAAPGPQWRPHRLTGPQMLTELARRG